MSTDIFNPSETIRFAVRERYGSLARKNDEAGREENSCCPPTPAKAGACCGGTITTDDYSTALGYSASQVAAVPGGSNLGLGCGNPIAAARLQPRDVVLDLGSGAGFDCFLAAAEVGTTGKVIGVDMTSDMLLKARRNAEKGNYTNVEFRLGEIEHLPLADAGVDVIISNCVINLSPDKPQVFREAFRVLKSGGRLCISDVVTTAPLSEEVRRDLEFHCGCLAGASVVDELRATLEAAGFADIRIQPKDESHEFIKEWAPGSHLEDVIVSAVIEAVKA